MLARTCHHFDPRTTGKLRPASHSYLTFLHRERAVLMTIATLCAALIYTGFWLIRLLG